MTPMIKSWVIDLRHYLLPDISFDIDTNDVIWFCPRCHDEGRIAGWEDTFWDNGALEPESPS